LGITDSSQRRARRVRWRRVSDCRTIP
jgi:hypothetical protein